jgi:hypothetical protein
VGRDNDTDSTIEIQEADAARVLERHRRNALPAWSDCDKKFSAGGRLTELEKFIFDWCPVEPSDEREFYADLARVVDEKLNADATAYQEIQDCDKCCLCEDHIA